MSSNPSTPTARNAPRKSAARPVAKTAKAASKAVESSTARWGHEVQNKEEQSALKRLAILRKAAQLFNERGFYATSLNDLAAVLNVTKPSLYYYVRNKDDILLQILHHAMGQIDPMIVRAQSTGTDGLDKLRIFIENYVLLIAGDFGRCLVLSGTTPLEQASREEVAPSFRRIDSAVRAMVAEGVRDGSIAPCDPKLAAFSLFGSLHWITSWYKPEGALSPEEIAQQLFALFSNGVRTRAARPAKGGKAR